MLYSIPCLPISYLAQVTFLHLQLTLFQALDDDDEEFSTLVQFRMLAELKNESTALQYGHTYIAHVDDNIFSFVRAWDGTDR